MSKPILQAILEIDKENYSAAPLKSVFNLWVMKPMWPWNVSCGLQQFTGMKKLKMIELQHYQVNGEVFSHQEIESQSCSVIVLKQFLLLPSFIVTFYTLCNKNIWLLWTVLEEKGWRLDNNGIGWTDQIPGGRQHPQWVLGLILYVMGLGMKRLKTFALHDS